jgi:transcriptional regulator with XRE-family HTH domain
LEEINVSITFGEYLNSLRKSKRLSLREVCKSAGYDPSNWSKVERGILSPPGDEDTLNKWALALELEPNSSEFKDFIDKATIARGVIPEEIMNNDELLAHVPIFFRTIKGQKPSKEDLEKLIELLKRS